MYEKLASLIEEKKSPNSSEDIDKKIVEYLSENLKHSKDYDKYLEDVGRIHGSYYPIAASGVAAGLSDIANDQKKLFIESLAASCGKAFVYYVSATLLLTNSSADGIDILTKCCDHLTNRGIKLPTAGSQNKFRNAFLTSRDLKEKPLKALLNHSELSAGIVIFIVSILFDNENAKGAKKNRYPMLLEQAIIQTEKIWQKLSGEKQKFFTNAIKSIIEREKVDDRFWKNNNNSLISSNFIKEFFPSIENDISENKSTQPSPNARQDSSERSPFETKKDTNLKAKESKDFAPKKLPDFEPLQVLDDIHAWIEDCPLQKSKQLYKWMEKNDPTNLLNQIDTVAKENDILQSKTIQLEKQLSEKTQENEKLKLSLKSAEDHHLFKIQQLATEYEDKEKQAIKDLKDDVAMRLKPFVDDYLILKEKDDISAKCQGLEIIMENFIKSLAYRFDIKVIK